MKEVVQISIDKYKELDSLSKANNKEIEKKALELYEKLGSHELRIYLSIGSDYDDEVKINTRPFLYEKENKLLQDEEIELFEKTVEYNIQELITNKFGSYLSCLSNIRKKDRSLDLQIRKTLAITVTGWLVAMVLVLIVLLKQ